MLIWFKMNMIIACGSLKPEIDSVVNQTDLPVEVVYLPQDLHRTPDRMKDAVQKALDRVSPEIKKVVLGYGLCSNGVVGVKAPPQGLYIPKMHDCIGMFLGSHKQFMEYFRNEPGTYYLTKSWIDNRKDPMGLVENEYTKRVGREWAEEAMRSEIQNYKFIAYIETGIGDDEQYKKIAKENAKHFGKTYKELKGSTHFFKRMIEGPMEEPDFLYFEPGQTVKQINFLK